MVAVGLIGFFAAPVVAPVVLGAAGFGAAGVVGGSVAATVQAGIGNVVAGSAFAAAQSAGKYFFNKRGMGGLHEPLYRESMGAF